MAPRLHWARFLAFSPMRCASESSRIKSDPGVSEGRAVANLNARALRGVLCGHIAEIFHVRAEDGRPGEPAGFQNIVAAGGDEGAADESDVGNGVEAGELADGVEKKHVGIFVEGRCSVDLGAAGDDPAILLGEAGGFVEIGGFARGEEKKAAAPLTLDHVEGGEDGFFLTGNDAAGDDDGPAFLRFDLGGEPFAEGAESGGLGVVLHVAGDFDAIFGGANFAEAGSVGVGLGEVESGGGEDAVEENAEGVASAAEALKGSFGDAGVDEDDGNVAAASFAEEVGPNFGLDDDDEVRDSGR